MIWIQAIGLIGFAFVILSFWFKEKKQIIFMQIIANIFLSIHYYLLGAMSGGIICLITVIRNIFLYDKKDKKTIIFYGIIFSIIFIFVGMLMYNGFVSLIPTIATIFYTYLLLKDDPNDIRIGNVLVSIMWMIYNIFVSSYIGIINEAILAITNVAAFHKYKKVKKKSKSKR